MELEFLSFRTSKKKLLQRVKPMSKSAFAHLINPIISEYRKITLREARQKQFLQSNEVVNFLNKIGEPLEEYKSEIKINTANMNKSRFKALFKPLSDPEFAKVANGIISKSRGIDFRESRSQCYLFPKEVVQILDELGEVWRENNPKFSLQQKTGC
jgi:hypothetical protein